jgi:hypothetical protein
MKKVEAWAKVHKYATDLQQSLFADQEDNFELLLDFLRSQKEELDNL